MISASRESINKQLSIWVKDRLISVGPRLIVIEEIEALRRIGKMSYVEVRV